MKSNISSKEINSGKKIIDMLSTVNPQLLPHILKKYISEYQKFLPDIYKYGLWLSNKFINKIPTKYDKVIFLFSGLAASGKDSIYYEMIKLMPDMFFKIVTATTRPIRENESEGVDHYFIKSINQFKQIIKNQELLEYIKRGNTYYGLSKKSLDFALNQSKPIIYSQTEMSSWSILEQYISSLKKNILIIKTFSLPRMSLSEYLNWLKQQRTNDDLESRISKSGWELKMAPKKVDFLVTNRIQKNTQTLTYISQSIINYLLDIASLPEFSKFKPFLNPPQKTNKIEDIISFHDSIQ